MKKTDIVRTNLRTMLQTYTKVVDKYQHLTQSILYLKEDIEKLGTDIRNLTTQFEEALKGVEKIEKEAKEAKKKKKGESK